MRMYGFLRSLDAWLLHEDPEVAGGGADEVGDDGPDDEVIDPNEQPTAAPGHDTADLQRLQDWNAARQCIYRPL